MSDHDLDLCPRCGIERQRTKSEASCGSGYMAVGCFTRAEAAEAERDRLREALVQIARDYDDSGEAGIARAALAGKDSG